MFLLLLLMLTPAQANIRCNINSSVWLAMPYVQLDHIRDDQILGRIKARLAATNRDRAQGMQNLCPRTISRSLLFFQFAVSDRFQFHMHNVHAPLDIAYLDANYTVIETDTMAVYGISKQPLYTASRPFRYVLEGPKNFFKRIRLRRGDRLQPQSHQ